MTYQIEFSQSASEMLKGIQDRRIREKISERIDGLAKESEKQGKELAAELEGYRSLRAVGQRYRIIYRIDGDKVIVVIVAVGIRKEGDKKDIYALAKKLIKAGLLKPVMESETQEPAEKEEPSAEPGEEKPPETEVKPAAVNRVLRQGDGVKDNQVFVSHPGQPSLLPMPVQ